ncbi:hypothetical protein AVEN_192651-1, partial [Araneus ventricosus]
MRSCRISKQVLASPDGIIMVRVVLHPSVLPSEAVGPWP